MVKSGGAAALVFVLSLLLGGCASGGSIPVVDVVNLPSVTRTGIQPGRPGEHRLLHGGGNKTGRGLR